MSLEALIETHGYWVVFVGTFIEGETILLLAAVAAHGGYLSLPGVIGSAFLGSLLCDQIFFQLGRLHGPRILARRPAWRSRMARVESILRRHGTIMILGFRFLYGLRSVTPFAVGMSGAVSTSRFVLLNLTGAAVWAIAIGLAGYGLGHTVEAMLGRSRQIQLALLGSVAVIGLLVWGVHFPRGRRIARDAARSPD